jgi:flavin reductase (DIM6/NTAB) family NADH-FMN oxidoreductase RutF
MASSDAHIYEPSSGHGLRHDPLNSIIGPRPIGWISSMDPRGRRNLAPYSFFNAFNYKPPIIGFATIGWKDTVANVQETGGFVWNLATELLSQQMNVTSTPAAREQDEFELAGLTPTPSRQIEAPRVLESAVNFECRLTQVIQLTTIVGATVETWLTLGEVVAVHIDRAFIQTGIYQAVAAQPVLRWGRRGDDARIAPENVFEFIRTTLARVP